MRILLLFLFLLSFCSSGKGSFDALDALDAPDEGDALEAAEEVQEEAVLWEVAAPPQFTSKFLESHSYLKEVSVWHTQVNYAKEKPATMQLGAFGTGNGYVFALSGMTLPLNTLHTPIGPTYQKDDLFFGDYALIFGKDSVFAEPEIEYAVQSLSVPAIITISRKGNLEAQVVTFAPWRDENLPRQIHKTIVRIIVIRNLSQDFAFEATIGVKPNNKVVFQDNAIVEKVKSRIMLTFFSNGTGEFKDGALMINTGKIEPGGEKVVTLFHSFGAAGSNAQDIKNEVLKEDPYALLDETSALFLGWRSKLASIKTPDPAVNHLLETNLIIQKNQISAQGASSPMSEYTGFWTRDIAGPVRCLLQFGAFDEVKDILDYYYFAASKKGDLANSFEADIEFIEPPPEPDWNSLPTLSGKTAAESPSFVPLIYYWYIKHTGDANPAKGRIAFLRRALLAQAVSDEGLLPFSGDETYRAAMNASFGLELEYPHHEKNYSFNSSALFLGAAKALDYIAELAGDNVLRTEIAKAAFRVEEAIVKYYPLEDGCFAAFVEKEGLKAYDKPFEDAALQVVWSGWMDGGEKAAKDNIACLIKRIGIEDGVLQSPLNEIYYDLLGIPAKIGVFTGMLPGYTLYYMAKTGGDQAEAAFNAMNRTPSSGEYTEYMIRDSHLPLTIVYDPSGVIGDYTARYRPWEGGINAHAIMHYLTGFEPDEPSKTIRLRPHLPNKWKQIEAMNLASGGARFDMIFKRKGNGFSISVKNMSASEYKFVLTIEEANAFNMEFTVAPGKTFEKDFIQEPVS